jgi:hypothetical protein
MVRALMEHIFAPDALDQLFEATAEKQYQRNLLFSSVVGLMSLVVCGMYPSVSAAYKGFEKVVGVSKVALYDKLNGLEPGISQALVRYSHEQLGAVRQEFSGADKTLLAGYPVRIIDGNHLASTEHRLKVLREEPAGPLPGQTLVVLDPQAELVVDAFPEPDGHAQERSILPQVVERISQGEVWIADRNFCTAQFLQQIDRRDAYFVIRAHKQVNWTEQTEPKSVGSNESGTLSEHGVELDNNLRVRRIVVELKTPTRHGDTQVTIFSNLPVEVDALTISDLYLRRWRIENLFQTITDTFHCELKPLGYPQAALFVFCLALVAFNILSVVRAALKEVHGSEVIDQQLSDYYVVEDVQSTWRGMEIALPSEDWEPFGSMKPAKLAQYLKEWSALVNLKRFRKSTRGPKKPTTKKKFDPKHPHIATARLLS